MEPSYSLPPRLLSITGQSGSGKGLATQTVIELYKKRNIPILYISSGDLVREYCLRETYLASKVRERNNQGILTQDFIAESLITDKISKEWKEGQYIILDGTPRYVEQCIYLQKWVDSKTFESIKIMEIIASEEKCFQRLFERTQIDKRLDLSVDGSPGVPDETKIQTKLGWWPGEQAKIKNYCLSNGIYEYVENNEDIDRFKKQIEHILFPKIIN